MHRKPMTSLLSGSLVFGLILVSLTGLPDVLGWQQATVPAKKDRQGSSAKASKEGAQTSKTKQPPASTLPQPPSPTTVRADDQVKTATTPATRAKVTVFDVVASEPISNQPIGGKAIDEKETSKQPVKKKPAAPGTKKSKPENPQGTSVLTTDPATTNVPAKSPQAASSPGQEPASAAPIGTAVRSVEKQPVVRSIDSSNDASNQTETSPSRESRFGIDLELKFPGSDKIQERLKSLTTQLKETVKGPVRTGQGEQAENSSRRSNAAASSVKGNRSPPEPESPRIARQNLPFSLPSIAVPRLLLKKESTEDPSSETETVENGTDRAAANQVDKPAEAKLDTPRPLSFRQLTPGRSSLADLTERFGAVQETSQENGVETLTFQVGPFQQVKVVVSNQIVRSIRVFFKESYSPQEIAKQLGIEGYEPVIVRDSRGLATSSVYPERGVTCVYASDADPVKVKQLVLDPISPVPFLQRAQAKQYRHYQDTLDDLTEVQRLDPKNEEAHAMEARILMQMGQFKRAMRAVDTAMELQPATHTYQLIRAQIQYHSGQWEAAEETIQTVLDDEQINHLDQAQAMCLLGDLYGRHGQRDYQVAVQHHLDGIKRAKSLVGSADRQVSHRAKRILLDAHLAIANDIAWGDWKNKLKVVPKWLNNSQALLENLSKNDKEDAALSLYVQEQFLSVHMGLSGELDSKEVAEDLMKNYNELLDSNSDALFKQRVRWLTGTALYYAGRIAQQQGKSQEALRYATDAYHLLTTVAAGRDVVAQQEILIGDACFLSGSLQAVYKNDHREAANWYRLALKKYEQTVANQGIISLGLHGERFVSMGLSFWQNGDHQQGLQLTQQGTDMIEQAVEEQDYQAQVLTVPFGNLAAMYRYLEKEEQADRYAQRVIKLKETGSQSDGQATEEKAATEQSKQAQESAKPADVSEPDKAKTSTQPEDPTAAESEQESRSVPAVESEPIEKAKDPAVTEPAKTKIPQNPIRKSASSQAAPQADVPAKSEEKPEQP